MQLTARSIPSNLPGVGVIWCFSGGALGVENLAIDLFGDAGAQPVAFRCRDHYSLSEQRLSRLLEAGERIACSVTAPSVVPAAGTTLLINGLPAGGKGDR